MLTPTKLSKNIKPSSTHGPLTEKLRLKPSKLAGNMAKRTLEPSSGGIGIRLKTPKTKLIKIK